jgi:hypothetical protein
MTTLELKQKIKISTNKKTNIKTMKTKTIISFLGVFLLLFLTMDTYSQTVELITNNYQVINNNTFQFDFWVKNTSGADWTYSSSQEKWTFNNLILNGGTAGFTLVANTTDFPLAAQVGSTAIAGTAPNLFLRGIGKTGGPNYVIPAGTTKRLSTFQITTTASSFNFAQLPTIALNTSNPNASAISYWSGGLPVQFTGTNRVITNMNANTPLPVELASFNGNVTNKRDIILTWKTSSEVNNSGFDVERKPADGQWSKVAFVNGKGNSSTAVTYNYQDTKLNTGKYNYRLKQIDYNGNYEYFELNNTIEVGIPTKFNLSQNYPNPFNPTTKIDFDLPLDSRVNIVLYDVTGREVKTLVNETRTAGYHTIAFDASSISSGMYFYRITTKSSGQDFVATKKMMLVK